MPAAIFHIDNTYCRFKWEAKLMPGFKFRTVVIDAGHGGKDPGAHGSYSSEKNVALAIAKKVELLLKNHACRV